MKNLIGNILLLILLIEVSIFGMEVPEKTTGPLPLKYQLMIQTLTNPKIKKAIDEQRISQDYELQKMYPTLKNYVELGFTNEQLRELGKLLLSTDKEKFDAFLNLISQVNYKNSGISPDQFAQINQKLFQLDAKSINSLANFVNALINKISLKNLPNNIKAINRINDNNKLIEYKKNLIKSVIWWLLGVDVGHQRTGDLYPLSLLDKEWEKIIVDINDAIQEAQPRPPK